MSTTNLPLDLDTLHSTYALCQPPIFPWILTHFIQHMHCVNTTNLPLDLDTLHSTYALCQPPIFPWILTHFIQHMHCVNHQSSLGSWHTSFNICTVSTTNLPLDLSTLHSTYALCQPPIFPWILTHFIQHMHCVNHQSSLGSWHTSFNICTVSTTNLPLDLSTLHSTYALC